MLSTPLKAKIILINSRLFLGVLFVCIVILAGLARIPRTMPKCEMQVGRSCQDLCLCVCLAPKRAMLQLVVCSVYPNVW